MDPTISVVFKAPLSTRGRNGKVFLVDTDRGTAVCKVSRIFDFSTRHEHAVLEQLARLGSCHFPKTYGLVPLVLDADFRARANPLYDAAASPLPPVSADGVLIEYIEDAVDMDKFLHKNKDPAVALSLTKQVLLAVAHAHEACGFTHYDMHTANVVVQKTSVERFEFCVFGKTHHVPSCGYRAVVIDFGLSYVDGANPAYCALFHTEIGVTSLHSRAHTDFKLFLVSLEHDLGTPKLSRFVRKMYSALDMDPERGWDNLKGENAVDNVYSLCYSRRESLSRVFTEYGYLLVGMVQSLCDFSGSAPVFSVAALRSAYRALDSEMAKIESQIGSVFYCIYIFGRIVDAARAAGDSVAAFRDRVLCDIDRVATFCMLPTVDWRLLLVSVYELAAEMSAAIPAYVAKQQRAYKVGAKTHADLYAKFVSEFSRSIC